MSTYYVTGATGSTGRRVVEALLRRPDRERVFALVGPHSADHLPSPRHAAEFATGEPVDEVALRVVR